MSDTYVREHLIDFVPEGTTPPLRCTFRDPDGVATQPAAVTLTIHRNGTPIGDADRDVIANVTDGVLEYYLLPADTTMVGSGNTERHTALLEWTWGSPAKTGKFEIVFTVANMLLVP